MRGLLASFLGLGSVLYCAAEQQQMSGLPTLTEFLETNYCQAKKLQGSVGDCYCDYNSVNKATENFFVPVLEDLVTTPFFRYFKVNLEKECPFWEDDGVCMIKDCAVCGCEAAEVPKSWILEDNLKDGHTTPNTMSGDLFMESAAERVDNCEEQEELEKQCDDRFMDHVGDLDRSVKGITDRILQELDDDESIYVDLTKNPEGYTGYSGPSAARVWGSIHKENCFSIEETQCLEKRVFYRLISGLQGSITTQIAIRYKFPDGSWGYNPTLYLKGVGAHTDRLDNMYFAYLFLLRAVARAAPQLARRSYETGDPAEDARVAALVRALLEGEALGGAAAAGAAAAAAGGGGEHVRACREAFDESALFEGLAGPGADPALEALRRDVVTKFQNISSIMDCVGCEKCKLWGKLQTLGLGTALKILLAPEEGVPLARNEVVALVNTLRQFARSVRHVEIFRELELDQEFDRVLALAGFATAGALLLLLLARNQVRRINGGGGAAKPKAD